MLVNSLKKFGILQVVILITCVISFTSALITTVVLMIFQGYVDLLGILLSGGLPMVATPVISIKFSRLLLALEEKNRALVEAKNDVKTLSGLIPICASCKKIRDDEGYWNQIELYIQKHSDAQFSHGLCGECIKKLYGNLDELDYE
jgi:hypothetical protein